MEASAVPTFNTPQPRLTNVVSGANLRLSWDATYIGFELQAQTNAPGFGITNKWYTITSSSATNFWILPINRSAGSVFFRLIHP